MAKSRESADRRQRERAKQQKANAKRERRQNKNAPATEDDESAETDAPELPVEQVDEEQLLAELAKLHAAFDNEEIGFDDFEIKREELLSKLRVD